MFKTSLLMLLAAACGACSVLEPARDYRSGFSTSSGATVRVDLIGQTDLTVYVDGEKVIEDQLSLVDGAGRFSAQYKGQAVTARCSTAPSMQHPGTTCTVGVGRDSQTLRFY